MSRMSPWVYDVDLYFRKMLSWAFEYKIDSCLFILPNFLDAQLHPRVLMTHIPLYRRDWTHCGPYRSSPVINQVFLFYFCHIRSKNF